MTIAAAAAIVSTALLALPGSLFQQSAKAEPGSGLVAVSPIRIDTGDSSLKSMADMDTSSKNGGLVPSLAHGMAVPSATQGAISDVIAKFMNSSMT